MLKKLFVKGASFSYLRQIITIVLGLISLPLMLNYFGVTIYAVWVLVSSLSAYLNNISFGIPSAMMAMVAKEPSENHKYLILEKSFSILFMITLLVLLTFGIAISFDETWIGSILGISDHTSMKMGIDIFIISVLFVLLKLPIALYAQFFIGMNKVYISEIYMIFSAIITFLALILTIFLKLDVLMYAILTLSGQLLISLIAVFHVKLKYSYLKREKTDVENDLTKRLLHSGWSFFQVGIAAGLVWSTDNLVISHFLTVDDVTPYSIAFKIFTYTFLISATLNGVIGPIYGNAYAARDWDSIKKYSNVILRVLTFFGAIVWVSLLFFSKEMIDLWTHNNAAFGGYFLIFSLGLYGYILSYVNTFATVVYALNWADKVLMIVWAEALVNLLLSILFVQFMGIGGVALATALSAFLTAFLYLPRVIKNESNERLTYEFSYAKKQFFYLLLPMVILSVLSIYIVGIMTKIVLYVMLIVFFCWFSWKFLDKNEQELALSFFWKKDTVSKK